MIDNNFLTQEEINALLDVKDEEPSDTSSSFDKQGVSLPGRDSSANLELIMDFSLVLSVQLGNNVKNLRDIRMIGPGVVLELDRLINEPLAIMINNKLIAQGEVVIIDESFGIKITEIIGPIDRVRKLA